MGGLITDLVGLLLEALVWVFGLLTKAVLEITTLSEDGFSSTFSNVLLGENGLYHTKGANSILPTSGNQILYIVECAGLWMLVFLMAIQLMRSMLFKDYRPDNPLRVVGRGLIFAFIIGKYTTIVDTLIGGVFAPIYKTVEEQEDIAGSLKDSLSEIGRSSTAFPADDITNAIEQAGSTVLELVMINAVFIVSVIKFVVVLHLLIKFLALALEVIERFIEMFFLTMFGPLCIAAGYNPRSKVFGNWLAFFIDGYVLMAINIFMTKLSLIAIMNFTKSFNAFTSEGPPEAIINFIWSGGEDTKIKIATILVKWAATYSTIKIGCEFDDIMNTLGFKVAQAGGIENNGLFAAIMGGAIFRKLKGKFGKALGRKVLAASPNGRGGHSAVVNTVNGTKGTGILGSFARRWSSTPLFGKLPNPWAAVAGIGAGAAGKTGASIERQNALKRLKAAESVDKKGFKAFGKEGTDVWATMSASFQSGKTGHADSAGLKNITKAMNDINIEGTAVAAEFSSFNGVGVAKITMSDSQGKTTSYSISNGDIGNADARFNANGEIWSIQSNSSESVQGVKDFYKSNNNSNTIESLFNGLDKSSNIAYYEVDATKTVDMFAHSCDDGAYAMLQDNGELVRLETNELGEIQYANDMVSYIGADGQKYTTDISNFVASVDAGEPMRYKADDLFVLYESTSVSDAKQFQYFKVGETVDSQAYKLSLDENGNAIYKGSSLAVDFSQLKGTKMAQKEQLVEYGAPIAFVLAKENGTGPVKKVEANYSQNGEHRNNAVISIKGISVVADNDGRNMAMAQTKAGALVEVAQGGRKVENGKVLIPVAVNRDTGTVNVRRQDGKLTAMTVQQINKSGIANITSDGYMEVERKNTRVHLYAERTKTDKGEEIFTVYGKDGKRYTVDKALIRKQVVPVWDRQKNSTIVVTKGRKGVIENVGLSSIERTANGEVCLYSVDKEGNASKSAYGNFIKVGNEYKFVDESCVGYEVKGLNTQTYVSGGKDNLTGIATDEEGKVHVDANADMYEYGSGKFGFQTEENGSPILMSVEKDKHDRGYIDRDGDKTYNPVYMKFGSKGQVKMETLSSYSTEMYGEDNKPVLKSILQGMTDDSRVEVKDVNTRNLQTSGFMTTKETDPENYGEMTRYDWYDISRYEFEELIKKARKTEEEEEMLMRLEKAKKEISKGNSFYRMKSDRQTRSFMRRFKK